MRTKENWFYCRGCGKRASAPKFTTNSWMRTDRGMRTDVEFNSMDMDKSINKMNEFEKRHNVSIDGYPTIYLVKGDQVIEYDANPTQDSLTEFLNTTL